RAQRPRHRPVGAHRPGPRRRLRDPHREASRRLLPVAHRDDRLLRRLLPWARRHRRRGGGARRLLPEARHEARPVPLALGPQRPQYEDPEVYDEFYLTQLRELCTNYGELYELWFDGAGSAGREYA